MDKKDFWQSYTAIFGGGIVLAILLKCFTGYAALAVRIVIIIALLIIIKKCEVLKEEPKSANLAFIICILPVFYATFCFYGPLDRLVPIKSAALVLATVITTVLCEELFFRKIGVMLWKKTENFVPSLAEIIALVGAPTVASIINGFGANIVWTFGISVLSLALYLLTKSIDLSIAIHLLLAATAQFYTTFSTLPHLITGEYFPVVYASAGIILALMGYAIIKDNCLMQMPSEEN